MLGVEEAAECTAVDLIGADADALGVRRTLLLPFDVLTLIDVPPRPRRMRMAGVPGALALLVADAIPWPAPAPVVSASIEVLPHQLSAAMAFRTGVARRLLVTDAPGSGKTIQAGIAIADIVRLEPAARILVLVPAGLKAQWLAELAGRFALAVEVVDGSVPVAQRWAEEVEPPWARPGVFMASFDYVKRPEVMAHLRDLTWQLVVVDEAHHATRSSDRGAALDLLCRRGVRVLLLTATPHDGDDGRYRALCALGRIEDRDLLLLRRSPTRAPADRARRAHRFTIEPSTDERHARSLLSRYVAALRLAGSRESGRPRRCAAAGVRVREAGGVEPGGARAHGTTTAGAPGGARGSSGEAGVR